MQRLSVGLRVPQFHHLTTLFRNTAAAPTTSENLQLLCGHCNSVKGDRPQEYLVARLRELGIAA